MPVQSKYWFFMEGVIPHQAGRKQRSWDERAWLRDERAPALRLQPTRNNDL